MMYRSSNVLFYHFSCVEENIYILFLDPLPICDFKITCHLSSTFKFDYQHFFFSRNEYNISWENATTNVKPIYYLIGSRNGNVVFEENINNLMSYTLTEDLIRNDIHVEARNENTTISKSSQFLRIIPGGKYL